MKVILSNRVWTLAFIGLALFIICIELIIVNSSYYKNNSDLVSFAITADITIILPLLYYFIICRKLKVEWVSALIIFLLCIGLAALILPSEDQYYLSIIKNALIITESVIIGYAIIKIRKIVQKYKLLSIARKDFLYNLQDSLKILFDKSSITNLVAGEVCTLRYGLFFWIGNKEVMDGQKYFSTYKESGYPIICGVISFVLILETVGLHLLLFNWIEGIAIAALIISIYTFIFLISDLASVFKRPIVCFDEKIYLRIGIRWNVIIDSDNIKSLYKIKNFKKNKQTLDCSLIGNPNLLMELKEQVTVIGFYGIRRITNKIAFNVDSSEEFIQEINSML